MATELSNSTSSDLDAEFARLFWRFRESAVRLGKAAIATNPDHESALAFAKLQGWKWAEALLEASKLDFAGATYKALEILALCEPTVPDRWHGLYHFIRGFAVFRTGEVDESIKAFRSALASPKLDNPGNAWNCLGIAIAAKGEHDEAIKAFRNALEDPKLGTPGYTWTNLGHAHLKKGEPDEAINAYRKALDDPKYDTPGFAWSGLGMALLAKGEHDEAINAFRKALDDPHFHAKGFVWNSLGLALSAKNDQNEAIKAFRKALDDPNYQTPGYAWNNLGIALSAKGEQDEAIKALRQALDDPKCDMPARAWVNLGQSYAKAGMRAQAVDAFEQSLKNPDPQGGDHARARFHLQILRSEINTEALSPDDRALAEKSSSSGSTNEVESEVIAAIQKAGDTQYEKYLSGPDSPRDDTLSILRGWSSAVTLLEGSQRRWRGGGYFLKWRGFGMVIDPGFDFLRNFHDAGYHGREIHAVVVSHNHPDHNNDVKAIDDLRYELWKRLKQTKTPGSQPYILLWDEDTNGATEFGFAKPEHRHAPVVFPYGFPQAINLIKHPASIPFQITPFTVNHGADVPHAMGMVVELLDERGKPAVRIGYTADTAYFEGLHEHLAACDVLIAHISQPSIEELQDASKLKDVHLGYRGSARLLRECKAKLALIGEFWAGFTDLRISLVKGLRQRSGVESILPAGLAMHLRLPSLEIECTECKKPRPFSQIKVAPPTDNFGSLSYLCPNCMIG